MSVNALLLLASAWGFIDILDGCTYSYEFRVVKQERSCWESSDLKAMLKSLPGENTCYIKDINYQLLIYL